VDEAPGRNEPTASTRTVAGVVCPLCLADNVTVTIDGDRVLESRSIGPTGCLHPWFESFAAWRAASRGTPAATIAESSSPEAAAPTYEALDAAARLLAAARAPVFAGLTASTLEAQRVAVALADRVGGVVDPLARSDTAARWLARARVGWVSASLGEIHGRADLVVVLGDPASCDTRWLDRSTRFLAADERRRIDLPCDSSAWLPVLSALRAIVRGGRVESERFEASTGLRLDLLRDLAPRLMSARYGVLRCDPATIGTAAVEALYGLAADLNVRRAGRCVVWEAGGRLNEAGAEAVLGWQAGAPGSVDLGRGWPRHLPFEASAEARLARGAADLLVLVGLWGERGYLGAAATGGEAADRAAVPTIVIGAHATASEGRNPAGSASVALASSDPWLEGGGTVMRPDGVVLPLTPIFRRTRPTEEAVLHELLARVESRRAGTP
jgi:formylmethanofuran dehydrogenase subunit B